MGIKNLQRQLNEAGKIKIGMKGKEIESQGGTKFRPPVRLDHFIITTTEKNDSGDLVLDDGLTNKIIASGRGITNEAGSLTGIPIRLLYEDTDLNFPTRLASYVKGVLSCEGDGETARKRVDDFEKGHPCPCNRFEIGYDGKEKCKANGALTCIIDEAELFGQVHKFRTTSINSVRGILGGIDLIKAATKGRIAGLPLMLVVNNKSTTIPGSGVATTIQVVSICFRGDMLAIRNESVKMLEDERRYLLTMDGVEASAREAGAGIVVSKEEEADFIDEFMPDARSVDLPKATDEDVIDVEVVESKPAEKTREVQGDDLKPGEDAKKTQQKALVARLSAEPDTVAAVKLMRRLVSAHLVAWCKKRFPESSAFPPVDANKPVWVVFAKDMIEKQGAVQPAEDINIKESIDPELTMAYHPQVIKFATIEKHIDLVNAMTKFFAPRPINRTLGMAELLDHAQRLLDDEEKDAGSREDVAPGEHQKADGSHGDPAAEAESEECDDNGFPDDEGDSLDPGEKSEPKEELTKEQEFPAAWLGEKIDPTKPEEHALLKAVVVLKKELGINDPADWTAGIRYFTDQDLKPINKATDLSIGQVNVLIAMLERRKATTTDGVPF